MTIKIIIAAMICHAMIKPNQAMIILGRYDKSPSPCGFIEDDLCKKEADPLVPNRYYCNYILFLLLRSICRQKLTLTLLTHKSPMPNIVSIEINHFHYKLNH